MKLRGYVAFSFVAALAFVAAFAGVALAADTIDPGTGDSGLPQILYEAFTGGHYAYAASLALVVLVTAAKKWIAPQWKPLRTEAGNALLIMLGTFGAAMSAALAGGGAVHEQMLLGALSTALAAVGGYSVAEKLLVDPVLRKLAVKAPKWLQPLFSAVLWIFEHEPATPTVPPAPPAAPTTGGTK